MPAASTNPPRISGHETFVCRFAWLPKTVAELNRIGGEFLFKDEDDAMVRLGVGKNMVHSARFWAEATQIIAPSEEGGYSVTPFGNRVFGHEGHDPYLERNETLWLIHWKIATRPSAAVFYWQQMLNYWHRPEFSASEAIPFLERGLPASTPKRSERTLADGYRVFVNSYVPTRSAKGEVAEDNLDCPLVELGLIRKVGDRQAVDQSGHEPIYSFQIEEKPTITPSLFAYCLNEFWQNSYPEEQTLAFRFASSEVNSPGQIFKLPELAVRSRLECLSRVTSGALEFIESRSLQQVVRHRQPDVQELLDVIYE